MTENLLREIIVKCLDKITNCILYFKLYRPLEREKDPVKRLEKRLWLEIRGAFLGGMAAAGAWTKYKSYYYDKLPSENEKLQVRNALLSMLKSNSYSSSQKALIAYVCADLEIKEASQDVNKLLKQSQKPSDIKIYRLANEALSRGIPVHKLVDEKFRRGEKL